MKQLKQYILDNNLIKGLVEYKDFFDYNRYMAMKRKNVQKLKASDLPKIDLDSGRDSSCSYSDPGDEGKESSAAARNSPRSSGRPSEMDEVFQHISPGLQKMYENQFKMAKHSAEENEIKNSII